MNRATRKPGEHYTIWMTRKMPHSALKRMKVLSALHSIPMWKVHQVALKTGLGHVSAYPILYGLRKPVKTE